MHYSDWFQKRNIGRRGENKKTPFFSYGLSLLLIFFIFWTYIIYSTGSLELVPKTYTIDKWVTVKSVPTVLKLDISSLRYSLWIRFFAPKDIIIKVWTYEVSRGTTLMGFFTETLKKPKYTDLTITILPWWNIYDIDNYLLSKNIIKQPGEFITEMEINKSFYEEKYPFLKWKDSFEGFLYPETYRLKSDATPKDVLIKLLSEWEKKIGNEYNSLWNIAYKKLIMASIVLREERDKSEQSTVAGILEKRVREWMAMWADATVCTGYAKTWKQCTPEFIASVIQDKNPFNTRNKQGYPPTPISNITQDVWNATIHTEESPYYYYLHDNEWTIHYAKTLEEHVINKQKYLK